MLIKTNAPGLQWAEQRLSGAVGPDLLHDHPFLIEAWDRPVNLSPDAGRNASKERRSKMSAAIHHNPRFEELRDLFRAHSELFVPWCGTMFRFQTVDFPTPKNVLSGEGAKRRGGRWNPPGLAALYGSTTDATALEECKANDRYYGVETKTPRLLVAIEAKLTRVLNLTKPNVRRAMGVTLAELAAEDWRKLLAAGKESFTQAIGWAATAVRASGVLAPSATVHRGVNVIVFPGVCTDDRLEVVEGKKLERLGAQTKG